MKTSAKTKLHLIPSVHQLAEQLQTTEFPRDMVIRIVRDEIVKLKKRLHAVSFTTKAEAHTHLLHEINNRLSRLLKPSLKRVINGTGIILHTGLGRAPLSEAAIQNLKCVTENYCNIELDLHSGERGDRMSLVEELICLLTGAEGATVVNNNAAAVLVVLNTLAYQKEVIISRGELVEIGGSFRIPDVMEKSGAVMHEVGTTNKTHLRDYENAVSKKTGLLLAVHTSNYRIIGFTKSVSLKELAAIGKKHKLPLVYDLGGGAFIGLEQFGLSHEPVVSESIAAGADVVTFSGDKILGGCQAGIIAGRRKYIDAIKKNPLMRALRSDKMTFAVLEATLKQILRPDQLKSLSPVISMLTESIDEVQGRAIKVQNAVGQQSHIRIVVRDTFAQAGSGTLPLEKIPSVDVTITSSRMSAKQIAERFRFSDIPIVGFVKENAFHLDMRTVRTDEVEVIVEQLKKIMIE
ncbi:L-seryl-tRNA(Sec) selenium transferase [bacterium]|nr:MAG: L-seryl-tRNA(Sec) selenium transferase [bacterium]